MTSIEQYKRFMEDVFMADGSSKGNEMLEKALTIPSSECMIETHMKTDDNSYLKIEDSQVDIYKLAYKEGYKAGFIQAINSSNRYSKDGGDIKFGKF